MSIQSALNRSALSLLPRVIELIKKEEDDWKRNQMGCIGLSAMLDSVTPVKNMTEKQLKKFEDNILEIFAHREKTNWGKE